MSRAEEVFRQPRIRHTNVIIGSTSDISASILFSPFPPSFLSTNPPIKAEDPRFRNSIFAMLNKSNTNWPFYRFARGWDFVLIYIQFTCTPVYLHHLGFVFFSFDSLQSIVIIQFVSNLKYSYRFDLHPLSHHPIGLFTYKSSSACPPVKRAMGVVFCAPFAYVPTSK